LRTAGARLIRSRLAWRDLSPHSREFSAVACRLQAHAVLFIDTLLGWKTIQTNGAFNRSSQPRHTLCWHSWYENWLCVLTEPQETRERKQKREENKDIFPDISYSWYWADTDATDRVCPQIYSLLIVFYIGNTIKVRTKVSFILQVIHVIIGLGLYLCRPSTKRKAVEWMSSRINKHK